MTAPAGFEPAAEVTADDRSRIPLGKAGVHRNDRYAVYRSKSGETLLTPLASIPRRELIVWEDGNLRASVLWESYVENHTPRAWRMFWMYGPEPDGITVVAIGPHPD